MSVLVNNNGSLVRQDAAAIAQLAAVDTENILGGGAGATTDGQTLVDQLAADDKQAQTDIGQIRTDLSDYHVVPSRNYLRVTKTILNANSVTWTRNSNDTFTANGTASGGNSTYWITADAMTWTHGSGTPNYLPKGRYKLINKGTGAVNNNNIFIGCNFVNTSGTNDISVTTSNNGESSVFEITDANLGDAAIIFLRVASGQSVTNVPFYPMIVRENETNHTYEPYFLPMRDGKLDIADYAVTGAVNFFNNTIESQTINSVVWVKDETTKKLTANGMPTGGNSNAYADVTLEAGTWYFTGCPKINTSTDTYVGVQIFLAQSPWTEYGWDMGDGVVVTLNAKTKLRVQAVVFRNKTVSASSCVFELMVSNIKGAPYVPFAMTNAELTNVVDATGMSYPVQSVYELGTDKFIYKCGKIVNISMDIKSLTAESYPGGQSWTTVGSGFPKPHKGVVQNIPAPFADGKLMQAYLTTTGNLQVRGGSVNTNWYTLQLTYICD